MVINDQDSAILKNTSNVFHLNTVLTSKKTQQYKTNKEKKKKKNHRRILGNAAYRATCE